MIWNLYYLTSAFVFISLMAVVSLFSFIRLKSPQSTTFKKLLKISFITFLVSSLISLILLFFIVIIK